MGEFDVLRSALMEGADQMEQHFNEHKTRLEALEERNRKADAFLAASKPSYRIMKRSNLTSLHFLVII